MANKIEAAASFTTGLETTSKIVGYSGTDAAASAATWLATVGSTEESKDTAVAGVDTAIDAAVAAGGDSSAVASQSFTLTTAVNSGADFTGGAGDDTFNATAATAATTTLTAGDSLTGAGGEDTLSITASTVGGNTLGAGVATATIEKVSVNAVTATTLDATLMSGVTDVFSNGSLASLSVSNLAAIPNVHLTGTSSDTTIGISAAATVGTGDEMTVALSSAATASNANLTAQGIEIFNVTASVASGSTTTSQTLTSSTAKSLVITGAASTNITVNLAGAGATAALTGNVTGNDAVNTTTVTADLTDFLSVNMGGGNDALILGNGVGANYTLAGGEGVNALALTQAGATAANAAATISGFDVLSVVTAGTGIIDMDDFEGGFTSVIYDLGLAGATTVDDAVTGTTVEVDVTAVAQNLTVDLKTDGATDAITIVLDDIGAGDAIGTIDASDAETLTVTADDDTVTATGTVAIAGITLGDATSVVLSGDAATTITTFTNPTTAVLTSFNSGTMTGNLTMSGLNLAAAGATITLGSGDDSVTMSTGNGADTIDLSAGGANTIVYTAQAQSSAAGMDIIKGFVSGSDSIDLTGMVGNNVTTTTQFGGVGASRTAAEGLLAGATAPSVVYQSDDSILWVDVNGDNLLNANDWRVNLEGVSTFASSDLNLAASGNTVAATAAAVVLSTTVSTNASALATNEADTITSTSAFAVGSTFDGGQGTDSISFSLTAGGVTIIDLDDAAGDIENIESVTLGAGVTQVNLLTVDAAANAAGEVATLTGVTATAQTLLVLAGGMDLTDTTNTNIETISTQDVGGAGITTTIDVANLTNVTRLVIDDLNAGAADTLSLAGGTYNFSAIDLDFDDAGVNNVLTMDVDDALGGSITLDDADIDNLGVLTGEATAGVTTTIATVGALDLSVMAVTEIDTFTIGGVNSTLTMDGDDYTAMQVADTPVVTITGSGDDNLTFAAGGGAAAISLADGTISGVDTINVAAGVAANALTLDAAAISGNVTLVGAAGTIVTLGEAGDYSNITLTAAQFTDLTITAGVATATVGAGMFTSAINLIDGAAAGADTVLTIAMGAATALDLSAVLVGTTNGTDVIITGSTGSDTITAADRTATGSTFVVTGNGGSDTFRLEEESGNAIVVAGNLQVVVDAVSITDFDVANDVIALASAFSSGTNAVVAAASGASNVDTSSATFINNSVMSDFSDLVQLGTSVGAVATATAGDDHYYLIGNGDGSKLAVYAVTFAAAVGGALTTVDTDDNVSLVAVIDVTGTFSAADVTMY
jgi:S-layer protein